LVVEDAVTNQQLNALRHTFSGWVEEGRSQDTDYGETLDGRPRSDLQPSHSAQKPGL